MRRAWSGFTDEDNARYPCKFEYYRYTYMFTPCSMQAFLTIDMLFECSGLCGAIQTILSLHFHSIVYSVHVQEVIVAYNHINA